MSFRTLLTIGSLGLLLTGCTSKFWFPDSGTRPKGAVCRGICSAPTAEKRGPKALIGDGEGAEETAEDSGLSSMASAVVNEQISALMRRKAETVPLGIPERALADLPTGEEGRLNILALSAGGSFGAFGAGFLNGWSEQTSVDLKRPEAFDVVTGVSAGALLATHAFLGRSGDAVLKRQTTTITTADVLKRRSLLSIGHSNSLFDSSPLRETLEELVTPILLDEVAEATDYNPETGEVARMLLVLAVDLDSGQPRVLDLGKIARSAPNADRIGRYVDALMASSAIPIAFPPVFIDGAMHVDGGTRLTLFFNRYMEEQRAGIEGLRVPPPRLDIIVNSEASLAPTCTENTLLGIGRRSFSAVLDQLDLDSLYRAINEAERDGVEARYVTAEGSGCTPPDDPVDMFQSAFLRCLYIHGKNVGSSSAPWKTGLDDFPQPAIGAWAVQGSAACKAS
ncbi:MAG: patatin-like phospholipase family protein [Geminicoccaceae bacterium]